MLAGNTVGAMTYFRRAAVAEDALTYDEPPDWYLPSRNLSGVVLLRAGDLSVAKQIFRDELAIHVESGHRQTLALQKRFDRAWRAVDVALN